MRLRGFSLAETIIAISVLAILVMTLGGLIATGLASSDKGEEGITAVHVAESEMSRWKSRPYSELFALSGQTLPPEPRSSDGREHRCAVTVKPLMPVNLNPSGRVLCLTVKVEWVESTALGSGGTRTERPASLVLESVVGPGASL